MTAVGRGDRFTRSRRCPVCGGCDEDPRGQEKRCSGFLSPDGQWARCTREEHAGSAPLDDACSPPAWRHRLVGMCRCGVQHGPDEPRARLEPEATYDYRDEAGDLLFQVVRLPGKQFRQRRPDTGARSGWVWSIAGVRRVLYRLPELLASSGPVYVVEGERDSDTLRARGLNATTSSGGAGKARLTDWTPLRDREVVVIADRDEVGRKHASDVLRILPRATALECTRGKDVTEHLAVGGTLEELVPMASASARAARETPTGTTLRAVSASDAPFGVDEEPPGEPDDRPEVIYGPDVHRVCAQLDELLGPRDPLLYQRANELVSVVGSCGGPGIMRGSPVIRPLSASGLLTRVTAHIAVKSRKKQSERQAEYAAASNAPTTPELRPIQPPPALLNAFLQLSDWRHVRPLRGITESPVLRPDGSVCQSEGYDPPTGYLYLPSIHFPTVAESPSQDDARRALADLVDVFADFPYVDTTSRYLPVAAILSILARPAIDGPVPLLLFDASVMGSGKTLQCDVAHAIAVGRVPAHADWPVKPEEQEKLLSTYACAGPQALVLDNVKGDLGGSRLEATLTSTSVEFRMLGSLELRTLPWHTVLLASGNNVNLSDDMVRRTLLSRLESPLERPVDRADSEFAHPDLLAWVRDERPRLAHAALTILRAYAAHGWPDTGARLASYQAWARVVAGSILFAGGPDVTQARASEERGAVDDAGAAAVLVRDWARLSGGVPCSLKSVLRQIYPPPGRNDPPDGWDDVREAVEALAPLRGAQFPTAVSVAKRLKSFVGRWFGSRRLRCALNSDTKVVMWWVEVR